jgi:hypothetical protein
MAFLLGRDARDLANRQDTLDFGAWSAALYSDGIIDPPYASPPVAPFPV